MSIKATIQEERRMIIDLLRGRFGARNFKNTPVPDDVLHDILEAGRLSPSGGNDQPRIFGVITDRALVGRVPDVAYGQKWIGTAPLLIVLCTRDS